MKYFFFFNIQFTLGAAKKNLTIHTHSSISGFYFIFQMPNVCN